ncbi:Dimethyladenosine transferase 1, mitochondrial, partial [Geodia barretti]
MSTGVHHPGSVFTPAPKVDAVVLKLVPRLRPLVKVDHLTLERVVKALFTFRRKFIKRGASLLFPTDPHLLPLLFSLSGSTPHPQSPGADNGAGRPTLLHLSTPPRQTLLSICHFVLDNPPLNHLISI